MQDDTDLHLGQPGQPLLPLGAQTGVPARIKYAPGNRTLSLRNSSETGPFTRTTGPSLESEVEESANSTTSGGLVLLEELIFHVVEEGSGKDGKVMVKANKAKVGDFICINPPNIDQSGASLHEHKQQSCHQVHHDVMRYTLR